MAAVEEFPFVVPDVAGVRVKGTEVLILWGCLEDCQRFPSPEVALGKGVVAEGAMIRVRR